jgi:8-oxo-dGTP pyrophosphatase MutT (NUDIX family)
MVRRWTVLSSRLLLEAPPQRLRLDRCRNGRGQPLGDYLVREVNDIAMVVPVTGDGQVVLVRQYRHGIGDATLEQPSGLLEDGEEVAAAAARELLEETGYAARELEPVATLLAQPALQPSRLHVLLGHDARRVGEATPDPGEDLEVVLEPLDRIEPAIDSGALAAATSVAAALLALRHLGRGRA